MKERLEAIIREEREERREDADYFNRYEKILKDLYGQEERERNLDLQTLLNLPFMKLY